MRWPNSLAARERRALLLGGAVVASAWLGLRGVPRALRTYEELRLRHAMTRVELSRAEALLETESMLRDSLAAAARRLIDWAPRLIPGRTRAEAEAELASAVRLGAARFRARVLEASPVPDSGHGVFRVAAIRVRAEGDIAALGGWIADLETGALLLRVREGSVTAADPLGPATQAEVLRWEFVVTGWTVASDEGGE